MQPSTVLFLAANPVRVEPLRLGEECRAIEDKIRSARFRDQIRFRSRWAARPDDLLQALNEDCPSVLHFSGHGSGDQGLCFQSDDGSVFSVSGAGLSQVIQAAGISVSVVVLNACYSEVQAKALVAHVPCVIGMSAPIKDEAAINYAASFYRALAFGRSVANAHQQGMAALAMQPAAESLRDIVLPEATLCTASPMLMTRPDVDANRIYVVNEPPPRTRCVIVIKATLNEFNGDLVARVSDVLRQWTGDLSLEITEIKEGSVRLTVAVSAEGARRLLERWEAGQATQICGFEVSAVLDPAQQIETLVETPAPEVANQSPSIVAFASHGSPGTNGGALGDIAAARDARIPGVVVVWSVTPTIRPFRVPRDGLALGRALLHPTSDDRIGRQHAHVSWRNGQFVVRDLGSRNGTFVGGNPMGDAEVTVTAPAVLRTGRTISVLLDDIRPFEDARASSAHETFIGPSTAPVWRAIEDAARAGDNLLILGENGTGQGRMARGYARARDGRSVVFDPLTCTTPLDRLVTAQTDTLILEHVEQLGAYHRRVLRQLMERSDLRFVSTTVVPFEQIWLDPDLAAALSARRVVAPPLRERFDELPYLVNDVVHSVAPSLQIHSTFVETCLLRAWPGNDRELTAAVTNTVRSALAQGMPDLRDLLDPQAGCQPSAKGTPMWGMSPPRPRKK